MSKPVGRPPKTDPSGDRIELKTINITVPRNLWLFLKEKNIKHEEINQIVDDKNIGFWILGYLPDVNEDIVYNLEMGSFLDGKKDGVWRKYQNKKK